MDGFQADGMAVHLDMYKRLGFHQMFDPDATRWRGTNAYRLCLVTALAVAQCVYTYGALGYLAGGAGDGEGAVDDLVVVSVDAYHGLCCWKVTVYLWHAPHVWRLFDVARVRFLAGGRCREHAARLLPAHRRANVRAANACVALCVALAVQWIVTPVAVHSIAAARSGEHGAAAHADHERRMPNVLNLRYPVTVRTYNRNHLLFAVVESAVGCVLMYGTLMTDALLLSFAWVIIVQYEVLIRTFEAFNSGGGDNGGREVQQQQQQQQTTDTNFTNDYENMKSILFDQIRLYSKTKLYYSIAWPIILVYVAMSFIIIITMTFVLISICLSTESVSILDIIKIGFGLLYISSNLFLYCYLFGNLDHKMESVNFGIYSCNWTAMDLKTKKLILLAMRINNANKLKLKVSPKKIINLHFFAKVIMTSYNIVSVMLKIMKNEKDPSVRN